MKLYYEGVDIAENVSLNRCEHETFAEGRSDQLLLRFNDAAGLKMLTDSNMCAVSGPDLPQFLRISGCYAGLNKNVIHGITC